MKAVSTEVDAGDGLRFFVADLTSDAGWAAAVAGCDYVLHVASPLGADAPKDPDALIVPARDGALRVLRAASEAGVKRVVMTSACAAASPPLASPDSISDESLWTDLDDPTLTAYRKSKAVSEQAAWRFMQDHGGPTTLTTILPGAVFGPLLSASSLGSVQVIGRLLRARLPGTPRIGFEVVDVRDLADAPPAGDDLASGGRPALHRRRRVPLDVRDRQGAAYATGRARPQGTDAVGPRLRRPPRRALRSRRPGPCALSWPPASAHLAEGGARPGVALPPRRRDHRRLRQEPRHARCRLMPVTTPPQRPSGFGALRPGVQRRHARALYILWRSCAGADTERIGTRYAERGTGIASTGRATRPNATFGIAATALMTAVVTVFTAVVQVRNPASGGYFNLSDVAIVFAGITFGPLVGAVAGGLGTAISDLLLGYAQFAPLSFLAHGGEGLLVGLIALRRPSWLVPAWLAGVVWMLAVYFVGELALFGAAQAIADLLGSNWLQAAGRRPRHPAVLRRPGGVPAHRPAARGPHLEGAVAPGERRRRRAAVRLPAAMAGGATDAGAGWGGPTRRGRRAAGHHRRPGERQEHALPGAGRSRAAPQRRGLRRPGRGAGHGHPPPPAGGAGRPAWPSSSTTLRRSCSA